MVPSGGILFSGVCNFVNGSYVGRSAVRDSDTRTIAPYRIRII